MRPILCNVSYTSMIWLPIIHHNTLTYLFKVILGDKLVWPINLNWTGFDWLDGCWWYDSDWTASWLGSLWLDIYSERDRLTGHVLALTELDLPEIIQTGHPLIWQAVPQQALNEWFQTELVLTGLTQNQQALTWQTLAVLVQTRQILDQQTQTWQAVTEQALTSLIQKTLTWYIQTECMAGLCLDRPWNTFLLRRW